MQLMQDKSDSQILDNGGGGITADGVWDGVGEIRGAECVDD